MAILQLTAAQPQEVGWLPRLARFPAPSRGLGGKGLLNYLGAQQLLEDFGALGGISRRSTRRLREGLARQLAEGERAEVRRCLAQAKADAEARFALGGKELGDA